MSVTCLPPQPGKNVSFLKSALKSQITCQNSEGNQTSEGKIVSLWTLTYQTLLTISTKPSSQVPGPVRTLAGLSYWMRDVAMSAFHDFSGTFSCWSAVLNRGKRHFVTHFMVLAYQDSVPRATRGYGVSPTSGTFTASHGILSTDHCQQHCVSPSM